VIIQRKTRRCGGAQREKLVPK